MSTLVKWRYAGTTNGIDRFNARQGQKRLPWQAVKNMTGGYVLQEYDSVENIGKHDHGIWVLPFYETRLVDAGHRVWRHEMAREQGAWPDDARSKLSTISGE